MQYYALFKIAIDRATIFEHSCSKCLPKWFLPSRNSRRQVIDVSRLHTQIMLPLRDISTVFFEISFQDAEIIGSGLLVSPVGHIFL